MRKYLLVFLSVLGLMFGSLNSLYAQDFSGGFSVDVMSQYLWRGKDMTDSAVVQPDLSLSYKDFTVDFWADYDAGGKSDIDEVDFTLSYSHTFKVGPGEIAPSIGYIYYDVDGGDTQEIYAGLSYGQQLVPDVGLNIGVTVYRDVDTVHSTYVEGTLGIDVSALKPLTISPYVTASYYSYDDVNAFDPTKHTNGWNNVELGTDVSFTISGPLSGHAKIAYSFGNSDMGLDDEFYGGVGVSLGF